jgi:predicted metal-dependent hydrolase
VDGETFLYLGQEIPLRIVPGEKPALVLDSVFKLAQGSLGEAESVFETWYKKQARKVLAKRVANFAHNHNFKPVKVRISSARTRWGSCSPKKTLSFTWRLVMAPMPVIDYVVVHELCHLNEMNHSKAFWARVASILPGYKKQKKWLKDHGKFLIL